MIGVDEVLDGRCDLIRVRRRPGSDHCVIVFSHLEYPRGKFAMSKLMQDFPADLVFVNCLDNSWYQRGLADYATDIPQTAALLGAVCERIGASRIVTIGMSMGGYAAILFGCLLRAAAALAFTAELLIGEDHGRSYQLNGARFYDPAYRSLAPLMQDASETAIYLLYGIYDTIDLSLLWPAARLISRHDRCKAFFISGDHQVTLRLQPDVILASLLQNGTLVPGAIKGERVIDCRHSEAELAAFSLIHLYQARKQPAKIYDLIQSLPNAAPLPFALHQATACADLRRIDDGLAAIKRAVEADPLGYTLHHVEGMLNHIGGRMGEAQRSYAAALDIRPDATISAIRLASVLSSLHRLDDAEQTYRDVLARKPDHAEAVFRLGELLLGQGREAEGTQLLHRSVTLAPENASYRNALARAEARVPG